MSGKVKGNEMGSGQVIGKEWKERKEGGREEEMRLAS